MKKFKTLSLIFAFSVFTFSASAKDLNDIKSAFNGFSAELNKTLPNAAVQQNVYPDAWIGRIFPPAPPHFGVGLEMAVTKLNISPLKEVTDIFGLSGVPKTFIFPTFSANARIGGFFLPFDIGISGMYIDFSNLRIVDGIGVKYFNIGGDLRYAVLKGNLLLPKISIGAGFYYTNGNFSFNRSGFNSKLEYGTKTLFLQAQISKKIVFFTPYLGFRGIFSNTSTDWSWGVSEALRDATSKYTDTETSASGNATTGFSSSFIPQVFGGFGLSIGVITLNFDGSWDFRNSIWAGNLSIRFQL